MADALIIRKTYQPICLFFVGSGRKTILYDDAFGDIINLENHL